MKVRGKDGRRKRRKENQMAGESKCGPGSKRMRLPLMDTGFSPGSHLWQFKRLNHQVWIYGESKPTLRCTGMQPLLTVHRAIYVLRETVWALGYPGYKRMLRCHVMIHLSDCR